MPELYLVPLEEFVRIKNASLNEIDKLYLIADMCRMNTLMAVKKAGSGHLGSSFSSMDIVVYLYYSRMNATQVGFDNPNRDVYFSSKGHDVPGLYSVLFSLGVIPPEKFLKLRRLGGLDGHPSVGMPGIETSSGSLGMGISKARGISWAKRALKRGGRVFVMTGDGELQEGQNYEALRSAVQQKITNLTVIVDHNKVQSDKTVREIMDLGNFEAIFNDFGWHVARCNGHDMGRMGQILDELETVQDQPKVLIADTIKGKGISFMEHPAALAQGGGLYPWHAGAPGDEPYRKGYEELRNSVNDRLLRFGLAPLQLEAVESEEKGKGTVSPNYASAGEPVSLAALNPAPPRITEEYVSKAYGQALLQWMPRNDKLVVLDADLSADCKIRDVENAYPDRFIENGIAEQDMVSMAGGLAQQGFLPVVNSFANFLASRANEQIYNNICDKTKIIYACHYAGLIPAGPGKSHQSIRDISLFGALPNCVILEPCNSWETEQALDFCICQTTESSVLRLIIGPSPRKIQLPENFRLSLGQGTGMTEGDDAILFAYGPVMLHEALVAAEILRERNFYLQVVNMPWLNRVNLEWLQETLKDHRRIYILEDHAPVGGLGDFLLFSIVKHKLLNNFLFDKLSIQGFPEWGTPMEVLNFHKLDGLSLSQQIKN